MTEIPVVLPAWVVTLCVMFGIGAGAFTAGDTPVVIAVLCCVTVLVLGGLVVRTIENRR